MPRTTLASLLDNTRVDPAPEDHVSNGADSRPSMQDKQDYATPAMTAGQVAGDGLGTDSPSPPHASAVGRPAASPHYLQLERKELRIRLDQADELARLTRRLNRARGRTGERITDNTLIRVAVDLLLTKSDRLSGATELELRDSVTL